MMQVINVGAASNDLAADRARQAFAKCNLNFAAIQLGIGSGTTSQRPTSGLFIGGYYFDTTLGWPVWWNGTTWVNATGAAS